jgi:4-hydroxy-tetrahydrodipicolinate reductase
LQSEEVDVLVDYTSAAAVKENVLTAIPAGVHVVVGSSGLTADDYTELDDLAATGVWEWLRRATSRSWPRS